MSTKPKVAFFDFACCEGCQLQIANLEEDLLGLVKLVDVVEFREVLTGKAPQYDIAFVEGSITRKDDEERLKDIRSRSKFLVAYGQCAVTGGINKLKNQWHSMDDVKKEVYGDHYNMPHLDTYPTRGIDAVVKVDSYIPGCPIDRDEFLRIVKELLLGKKPVLPNYPVCVECKLKENVCLFEYGIVCLGPLARAGCGARCPANGVACEACRGTVDNPNTNAMHEILEKYNYTVDQIKKKINIFGVNPEVSK
ncbi:MAG: NADH:ubiquinone oxidoreductase [Candidatus Aminicenantes bacterium]|jgi:coenzyme F420-reducing hydrogenase gamma subunit